ncbi:hypothetical protein Anapl_12936 [Anas platyrhynchos]|uniref:Uncharacterized protein n=1 Tax=Anas platyrhynchos TaxID=8839 RepID=R0L5M8_ANAPL|nr:hypothetical protein Anapl_12936 [Anas platyrhynchos]
MPNAEPLSTAVMTSPKSRKVSAFCHPAVWPSITTTNALGRPGALVALCPQDTACRHLETKGASGPWLLQQPERLCIFTTHCLLTLRRAGAVLARIARLVAVLRIRCKCISSDSHLLAARNKPPPLGAFAFRLEKEALPQQGGWYKVQIYRPVTRLNQTRTAAADSNGGFCSWPSATVYLETFAARIFWLLIPPAQREGQPPTGGFRAPRRHVISPPIKVGNFGITRADTTTELSQSSQRHTSTTTPLSLKACLLGGQQNLAQVPVVPFLKGLKAGLSKEDPKTRTSAPPSAERMEQRARQAARSNFKQEQRASGRFQCLYYTLRFTEGSEEQYWLQRDGFCLNIQGFSEKAAMSISAVPAAPLLAPVRPGTTHRGQKEPLVTNWLNYSLSRANPKHNKYTCLGQQTNKGPPDTCSEYARAAESLVSENGNTNNGMKTEVSSGVFTLIPFNATNCIPQALPSLSEVSSEEYLLLWREELQSHWLSLEVTHFIFLGGAVLPPHGREGGGRSGKHHLLFQIAVNLPIIHIGYKELMLWENVKNIEPPSSVYGARTTSGLQVALMGQEALLENKCRLLQGVISAYGSSEHTVKNRDKKLRENLQAHPHTPSRKVAGLIIHIFSKFVKTPSGKKQQLGWRIALRQGH